MVEGPAGIGKTRLVLEAERHGRELGLTTLSARGAELERDFAYGLVRQLFEASLLATSPPERTELLAGAAGHAARLFGVAAAQEDVADALLDPSFAILHGLYWLSANLARHTPLLLCVDDVHWADQASLRFLHYLGRRLQELPIAVVAATRPARSADGSPLLAALAADPSAEILELAPLSQRAVAELLRLTFGTEVEQAFAAACHEVTGGVPFLLRELIRAVIGQGIEPTAAASSRVAGLAPRAVSHSVVQRLSRLSAPARELARAAAVLGEADLRLAAGLAGLDPAPPRPRPTNSPPPGFSKKAGRCASSTRSSGRRSRLISRQASGLACMRRRRAASHTRARLRTASRPTCWRPTRPGTIGSSIHSCPPPGPRSRMALRTRPSPICAGHCPNRRRSGSFLTSFSSWASPSRTRETRRPRLISRPHST